MHEHQPADLEKIGFYNMSALYSMVAKEFGEIKRSKNRWDGLTHDTRREAGKIRKQKQRNAFQRVVQHKQHDLSNVNGGQADNQN
jgi:hypothetical protein